MLIPSLKTPGLLGMCMALLALSGCGGSGDSGSKFNPNQPSSDYHPAVSISPYKDVLVRCATIERASDACRLSRLPFIGQTGVQPTKAEIMSRVVVSHDWMGTRFSQLLDALPEDIHRLFGSVTAVVIGADIRPSYYWAATGAIYLDPADLWLTASERDTISRAPDFRSDFARELNFLSLGRYVVGNNYAWDYYPLDGTASSRPLSAIVRPMAALLFHELAHANDFIPPSRLHQVNSNNRPAEQVNAFIEHLPSVDLASRMPLTSAMLYDLAKVMYQGDKASNAQKLLDAQTVGAHFASDGANETYAYSSMYEDTAMLFEEVMMKYHFNVDREIAFTDAPTTADAYCDAYMVRWGVRNRVADPLIQARAAMVVSQLLNRTDVSAYFANLPATRPMVNGKDWCANLSEYTASGAAKASLRTPEPRPRPDDLNPRREHPHTHLPH